MKPVIVQRMGRWGSVLFAIALLAAGVSCGSSSPLRRGGEPMPELRWEGDAGSEGGAAAEAAKEREVERLARDMSESPTAVYRLKIGDVVSIMIRTPQAESFEMAIDENGNIKLPYIDIVSAVGLTPAELESRIKRAYIDGQIYKMVTVNVFVPMRSYFVRGEIRQPGRFPLTTGMTLVQAIAACGGFTDFADPRDVRVLRGDRRIRFNVRDMETNPEKDVSIEAGDVIIVTRRFF
jgi:protein involved in polysaccharide export with SLBB domain